VVERRNMHCDLPIKTEAENFIIFRLQIYRVDTTNFLGKFVHFEVENLHKVMCKQN